jgi:hypothetical protein
MFFVVLLCAALLFFALQGVLLVPWLPYKVAYVPSADPAEAPRLGCTHARLDIRMACRARRRLPARVV